MLGGGLGGLTAERVAAHPADGGLLPVGITVPADINPAE